MNSEARNSQLLSRHRVTLRPFLKPLLLLLLITNLCLFAAISSKYGFDLTNSKDLKGFFLINSALITIIAVLLILISLVRKIKVYPTGIQAPEPLRSEQIYLPWEKMKKAQHGRFMLVPYYVIDSAEEVLWVNFYMINKDKFIQSVLTSAPSGNPFRPLLESELQQNQNPTRT